MASFCSSALSASHFFYGHWRSSLFKFLRWVCFLFWFGFFFTALATMADNSLMIWLFCTLHWLLFPPPPSCLWCDLFTYFFFLGGDGDVDLSMVFKIWCADHLMLNRNPFNGDTSLTLSFPEAITVMLLSQDKVAELPQRSVCFHFHIWPNGN